MRCTPVGGVPVPGYGRERVDRALFHGTGVYAVSYWEIQWMISEGEEALARIHYMNAVAKASELEQN